MESINEQENLILEVYTANKGVPKQKTEDSIVTYWLSRDNDGVTVEDVMSQAMSRLEFFNKGDLYCIENSIAIAKIREVIFGLRHREQSRIERGVLGTDGK